VVPCSSICICQRKCVWPLIISTYTTLAVDLPVVVRFHLKTSSCEVDEPAFSRWTKSNHLFRSFPVKVMQRLGVMLETSSNKAPFIERKKSRQISPKTYVQRICGWNIWNGYIAYDAQYCRGLDIAQSKAYLLTRCLSKYWSIKNGIIRIL
jgi:hypothetical protein